MNCLLLVVVVVGGTKWMFWLVVEVSLGCLMWLGDIWVWWLLLVVVGGADVGIDL